MYSKNPKKTTIAIDYDDTITLVPLFFKEMIENWKHAIDFHIVTYRSQNGYDDELREFEKITGHKVVFTDAKAKRDSFSPNIWIDDTPLSITHDWKSYGYDLAKSVLDSGDIIKKKCKWDIDVESMRCGGIMPEKLKLFGFKFCPYCSGEII